SCFCWSSSAYISGRTSRPTTSASCSIAPDSRKSDNRGLPPSRASGCRLSWLSTMIGICNSLARAFPPHEVLGISTCRLKPPPHQFVRGHLQAKRTERDVVVERRVFGDVHRQRRLAHRGPGGDHDHVAGVQAGRERVEVVKSGGNAGQPLAIKQLFDAVHRV